MSRPTLPFFKALDAASMLSTLRSPGTNRSSADNIGVRLAWTLLGPTLFARVVAATALPSCTAAGAGIGKTLTATANAALTVDGVAVAVNDLVLVAAQATLSDNGLYSVTATGSGGAPFVLTRATSFDEGSEVKAGTRFGVYNGTTYSHTQWLVDGPFHLFNVDTDSILIGKVANTSKLVRAATAAALSTSVTQSGAGAGATLTNAGTQAALSVDGVTMNVGDRVLVKTTTTGLTAANFGIYDVTAVGSGASNWVLTRSADYDQTSEIVANGLITVALGSTLTGKQYLQTATIATVDTTSLVFAAGEPTGTWTLEASNDSTDGFDGHWDTVTMTISTQPAGTAGSTLLDLNQLPWKFFRLVYTPSAGTGLAYPTIFGSGI